MHEANRGKMGEKAALLSFLALAFSSATAVDDDGDGGDVSDGSGHVGVATALAVVFNAA